MKNNFKNLIPIIILNWNGINDTIECLKSIKESDTNNFFVILVDNGSEKNKLDTLKNFCKKIYKNLYSISINEILFTNHKIIKDLEFFDLKSSLIIIENHENLGFAAGNNIALKLCNLLEIKWVMLLNNDTIISPNTFQKLLFFRNNNLIYDALTPQIRKNDNKNIIWNCGGKLTFFGSRKYYFENTLITKLPNINHINIDFVTGCALFYNFDKIGYLSEDFFFGEEDYEFSLRLLNKNLKIVCVLDSILYHKVGSTINLNSNLYGSIYIYIINRLINIRNYYSKIRFTLTKILFMLYIPILLYKYRCNMKYTFLLISKIKFYINNNNKVTKEEFYNSKNLF